MMCPWKELMAILPMPIRREAELCRDSLQELRLRLHGPVQLICGREERWLHYQATDEDIRYTVNAASRYSPWASATISQGFITAPGGHRIGLAGACVWEDGKVRGIRAVTGLCIRVARDYPGVSGGIPTESGSILLLGPPGWGKTTLLRDLIRRISNQGQQTVAVVDERGELFPSGGIFQPGKRTDVLTGCSKAQGIEMALRTLGPDWIAVDEITSAEDCAAMHNAGWCGTRLMATAHARDRMELLRRPVYKPIVDSMLFETLVILQRDKSWRLERIQQ